MNNQQCIIDFTAVAEIHIRYTNPVKPSQRPQVTNPEAAYQLFLDTWNPDTLELRESFKIMLLSRGSRVLGIATVSEGGMTGAIADPRLIFAIALKAAASGIILCHNHPSGNLKPSTTDITITRKIKEVGELLDITVFDHLIISSEGYHSFNDEGNL